MIKFSVYLNRFVFVMISQEASFDISCKLSPAKVNICMKCQSKKTINACHAGKKISRRHFKIPYFPPENRLCQFAGNVKASKQHEILVCWVKKIS